MLGNDTAAGAVRSGGGRVQPRRASVRQPTAARRRAGDVLRHARRAAGSQLGLRQAMVAPGSRSTPMALALAADGAVAVHVVHDERAAAFVALGVGLADGRAGRRAVHQRDGRHPLPRRPSSRPTCRTCRCWLSPPTGRPSCTMSARRRRSTRPRLYGRRRAVVPRSGRRPTPRRTRTWSSLADRRWTAAVGHPDAGPVHLNLPFREPLVGTCSTRCRRAEPRRAVAPRSVGHSPRRRSTTLAALVSGRRGRDRRRRAASATRRRCERAGRPRSAGRCWPTRARAAATCRRPSARSTASSASRAVRRRRTAPTWWCASASHRRRRCSPSGSAAAARRRCRSTARRARFDPDHVVAMRVAAPIPTRCVAALADAGRRRRRRPWLRRLGARPSAAPRQRIASSGRRRRAAADRAGRRPRAARPRSPPATHLVVASSMPVRDVEWYGGPRAGVTVHANRGANGIDGVVSTGVGVAARHAARPPSCSSATSPCCHDASALTGARRPRPSI